MTAERPTAPAPSTTTVLPRPGFSTFQTAPTPVWTPQPSGAIDSRGTSGSTLTTLRWSTNARSANEDWPKKWPPRSAPSRLIVAVPSARRPPRRFSGSHAAQYAGCPARQLRQPPQEVKDRTTWSPGSIPVTAEPTASTTPAPSCPRTPGSGKGSPPLATPRSVWHRPAATSRTSTSWRGLGQFDVGESEGRAAGLDDGGPGGDGHRELPLRADTVDKRTRGWVERAAQSSETTTDLTLVYGPAPRGRTRGRSRSP